ncbi:MAG: sugar phosphate isomerase/epimerase [Verrucomicrobiae bacterium]|nr:sugar phosphate isomerase/epimerase [Verrucomicrobiae bacterium]
MTPRKHPLIYFHKSLRVSGIAGMIEAAHKLGFEGYDLCCRAGFPVHPGNIRAALPEAVKQFQREGLVVPMLTGEGGFVEPTHPTAEPILGAMQAAGIGLIKLGYFHFNPQEDYWDKVSVIRRHFDGWARLGEKYGVRVCYHTHSGPHMGINAAAVMHLVNGCDPRWIGVYLDPGHQVIDGELPDMAIHMTRRYLAIVGLKDMRKEQNPVGPGHRSVIVRAGLGMVDWVGVFTALARVKFEGPLTVHGEFGRNFPPHPQGEHPDFLPALAEEVRFYRRLRDTYLAGAP